MISRKAGLMFVAMLAVARPALSESEVVYLDQGWSAQDRAGFYNTPQGSYLIPLSWFLSLEQPDSKAPFSTPAYIRRFKYLTGYADASAPEGDRLPVGFAIERNEGKQDWMGYTCGACHTNDIQFKGVRMRIDGAPTMADFQSFVTQLGRALKKTVVDDATFNRFARRVTKSNDPTAFAALRSELEQFEKKYSGFMARNLTSHVYGYGRLDAFGYIMNELYVDDLGAPENQREPNASVSYPFLWSTPQHDWVQWNGSANNPFGRNVGEVLGTFGSVELKDVSKLGKTTARGRELFELERLVTRLKAPKWPEDILGQIDHGRAENGRMIYAKNCASCHALPDSMGRYPMTPAAENYFGVQFVETHMTPLSELGTDPLASLNIALRPAATGGLAPYLPAPYTGQSQLPAPVLLSIIVGLASTDAVQGIQPVLTPAETAELIGYRVKAPGLPPYEPKNIVAYRARPLDGIWATAPYLHNGSVPNLAELLKPSSQRIQMFYAGSREFDTQRVGFDVRDSAGNFRFDTHLPGNSNKGHEYGTWLGDWEKADLLEFLKTL
ncbi:MAG: cytochrome C [Gammaproteobacteria bacterium]|nr:cytochrome C [Gammaproteobacteria bacterium]